MYNSFFSLDSPPFRITPDTSLFFAGGERGALLDAIKYAISHGEGIIKIVGEVGSGKTMLSRMLEKQLPDSTRVIYLLNPSLSAHDVVYSIAHELGLKLPSDTEKAHALNAVMAKLLEAHAAGRRTVVFIDEAQRMPLETLEELRLLSNLETETEKLLQIVLFGQPELDQHIDDPSVRQIRERITQNFYLKPLQLKEIEEYLSFRLHRAGYNGAPLFTNGAVKLISNSSSGLLRRINILADKSLLAAFSEQSRQVDKNHVQAALEDHSTPQKQAINWQQPSIAAAMLIIGLCLGLTFTHLQTQKNPAANENIETRQLEETLKKSPTVAEKDFDKKRNGLVETRIKATENHVDQLKKPVYTIQLMSTPETQSRKLEQRLWSMFSKEQLDQILIQTQTLPSGKSIYAILFGTFASYNDAKSELATLPEKFQKFAPYIKKLGSHKNEGFELSLVKN